MNIPNCPVCGMKPEVYLYAETLTDRYYTKISCINSGCGTKPSTKLTTYGGWPDDLSIVFNEWEYRARKHAEKEGEEK